MFHAQLISMRWQKVCLLSDIRAFLLFVASNQCTLTPDVRGYFFDNIFHMSSSFFDMISDMKGGRNGHHVCVRSVVGTIASCSLANFVKWNILSVSNNVVVPSEEAGDGIGQLRSVSSQKVREDASHLPIPTRPGFNCQINFVGISTLIPLIDQPPTWELVRELDQLD